MKIEFDQAQFEAINHQYGPMMVIAGAGTGKTLVLVERVARLVDTKLAAPGEILAITYTDNAAEELRRRIRARLGTSGERVRAATFHAFCGSILREAGCDFKPLTTEDLWVYLRRKISRLPLRNFIKAANVAEFLRDLLSFFDRCHDELTSPADYDRYLARVRAGELPLPRVTKSSAPPLTKAQVLERCEEIAQTFHAVEEMLSAEGLGSFGHMIVRAIELLRQDSDLLRRERAKARFILIDEFQDANSSQIVLARLLAGDAGNVFVVGDPDQAIYKFRGASSAAFEEFLRIFPQARQIVFERNHRSVPDILTAAHAVIGLNPAFFERRPLVAARQSINDRDGERGSRAKPRACGVEVAVSSAPEAEAADIADAIERCARGPRFRYSDCAILYRQHHHRAQIVRELAERNIPFAVTGLDALAAPDVRDLLACLRLAISPRENTALLRLAARPEFSLDAETIRQQLRRRPGELYEIVAQFEGGKRLLTMLQQLRDIARSSAMAAIAAFDAAIKLFAVPSDSAAVLAFRKFVGEWRKKPITETGELAEFLEYLDFYRQAGGTISAFESSAEDAVQLMTVHAAKGLEFERVFIVRAGQGTFPSNYREALFEFPAGLRITPGMESDSKLQHQQEERRLFYVGMTRARDALAIHARPGRGKDRRPSNFVRDLLSNQSAARVVRLRQAAPLQLAIAAGAEPLPPLAEWLCGPLPAPATLELSATAIERYQLCPLKYKLEREWGMPAKPTAALQFGAAMHTALKFFGDRLLSGRPASADELLDAFRRAFRESETPSDDPLQRRLYEEQAENQLRAFHSAHGVKPPSILSSEQPLNFYVGNVKIRGRLDRLDRSNGDDVNVVDYKTGSPRTQEDADESLQLSIYALGVRNQLQRTPERLSFYNLETGEEVSTTRDEQQLRATEHLIADVAQRIAMGEFEPKTGFHCNWCGYRDICPTQEERLYSIQPAVAAAGKVN